MTSFNFHNLLNDINSSWPQFIEASLLPAIGYSVVNDSETKYNNPHGYVRLGYIKNANENYKRAVLIRDTSAGGCPDKYTITILLSDGIYLSAGEDIRPMVDRYIDDRMTELKESATHLSKSPDEYPIEWTVERNEIATHNVEVRIRGTAYIPVSEIISGKLELGDVSKLMAGGMTLVQHPNHHDSYLELNRLGYCNDSWSTTAGL